VSKNLDGCCQGMVEWMRVTLRAGCCPRKVGGRSLNLVLGTVGNADVE